jgi:hypothetical protein
MRARAARPSSSVVVLVFVVTALIASAWPVAARPYGAVGRAGEVRYGNASLAKPRCVSMADNAGRTMPLCFHRALDGPHKASPAWMDKTVAAFKASWTAQVNTLGYRRPLPDGGKPAGHGPNAGLDIYLADVAGDGTFGFCTSDRGVKGERRPAFCVVDNDFAEFGGTAKQRLRELKGTAAHEFFHAVQYAYDATTPAWFSEGSAVWMEDQVFPGLNTNRRYLDVTALRTPEDAFDRASGTGNYGSWLFWQFLDEKYGSGTVRAVWARVAARDGSESDVFTAVKEASGRPLGEAAATFGAWNYAVGTPDLYAEGVSYLNGLGGTRPPLEASHRLTATRRSTDATGEDEIWRVIPAAPRSVHYVQVTAAEGMTVDISVNQPRWAARMKQLNGQEAFKPAAVFGGSNTAEMRLAAGQSALLVLTNPSASATTLQYRVVARP